MTSRILAAAVLAVSLAILPGSGVAQEQTLFGTVGVAGRSSVFVSAALEETDSMEFFPVSLSAGTITIGSRTYQMQTSSGSVKSGSVVTLERNGSFLSCCSSGKLTSSATTGDKERFTLSVYTAAQVTQINAKRAADRNRKARPGTTAEVN